MEYFISRQDIQHEHSHHSEYSQCLDHEKGSDDPHAAYSDAIHAEEGECSAQTDIVWRIMSVRKNDGTSPIILVFVKLSWQFLHLYHA